MKIPSKKQTVEHFVSIGYDIQQNKCSIDAGAWTLRGENLPLDRRTFPTRLELWTTWMVWAADVIHDNFVAAALTEIWERSDEVERSAFAEELRAWKNGQISPRLESLLSKAPAKTADHLPRDWQERIKEIILANLPYHPSSLVINRITERA